MVKHYFKAFFGLKSRLIHLFLSQEVGDGLLFLFFTLFIRQIAVNIKRIFRPIENVADWINCKFLFS